MEIHKEVPVLTRELTPTNKKLNNSIKRENSLNLKIWSKILQKASSISSAHNHSGEARFWLRLVYRRETSWELT